MKKNIETCEKNRKRELKNSKEKTRHLMFSNLWLVCVFAFLKYIPIFHTHIVNCLIYRSSQQSHIHVYIYKRAYGC